MAGEYGPGTSLIYTSAYTSLGSSALAGLSAILSAEYQADILDYQARYNDALTELEVAKAEREYKQLIGKQRAGTAAAGIAPDMATARELQVEAEVLHEIDIRLIRSAGSMRNLQTSLQAAGIKSQGWAQFGKSIGGGAADALDLYLYNEMRKTPTSKTLLKPGNTTGVNLQSPAFRGISLGERYGN